MTATAEELAAMLTSRTPVNPTVALLTEIRDSLRLIAADVERRAWPLVYVPGDEGPAKDKGFAHHGDVSARQALAAREFEVALVQGEEKSFKLGADGRITPR